MSHRSRHRLNSILLGALLTLSAATLIGGCSLPGAAGKTAVGTDDSFGLLSGVTYRQIQPIPLQPPKYGAQIIAHRGYSSRYPENTVSAIRAAAEAGADMVEIDVQLTKDGAIVVMHDDSVYRTTNGSGLVKDLTLEQIRALDAGVKFDPKFAGERVPTLDEAIEAVQGKAMLNIEIKNAGSEAARNLMIDKLTEAITRRNYASHVQIMAFDSDFMREMRRRNPHVSTALLAISNPFNTKLRQAAKLQMDGLNLLHSTLGTDEVRDIHKAGLKANVYTVNRQASMLKVLRKGADGLITDYPEVAAAAMNVYFNGGVAPDALVDGPDGEEP